MLFILSQRDICTVVQACRPVPVPCWL